MSYHVYKNREFLGTFCSNKRLGAVLKSQGLHLTGSYWLLWKGSKPSGWSCFLAVVGRVDFYKVEKGENINVGQIAGKSVEGNCWSKCC